MTNQASLRNLLAPMKKARTIKEGAMLLQKAGKRLGLPLVSVVDDLSDFDTPYDETGVRIHELLGWPLELLDMVHARIAKGQALLGRVAVQARFEMLPFFWSLDKPSGSRQLDRTMEKKYRAFGVCSGISIPVRMVRGRIGYLSLCGEKSLSELQLLVEIHGPDLLALAYYFFALLSSVRTVSAVTASQAKLTQREIECLTGAACGQSDIEISRSLALSPHTVRFYIQSATDKLGARTRTHAAALAAQLGMIHTVT